VRAPSSRKYAGPPDADADDGHLRDVAGPIVGLFTDDPGTVGPAIGFAITYGLTAPFTVLYVTLSGSLQGGSDTRTPFLARTTGLLGFYLGFSAVASLVLDWGVVGIYAGIMLYYAWSFLVVAYGVRYGGADRAAAMMAERGTAADD